MDAKKCDRCGKFYDEYNVKDEQSPNSFRLLRKTENRVNYKLDEYDLCPECMAKLQEWLQKGDKQ